MTQPHFVDVNGESFAYLEEGAPHAPVVLCLHGFPDHPLSFRPLMASLARAGYRAIAPWMRGYAPSTGRGPFDLDQLGRDACGLAEVFSPDRPAALIGHDWGAVATYSALAREPGRFRAAVTMAVPHPGAFVRGMVAHPAQLRRSWYMIFFQLPGLPDRVVARHDFRFIETLWRTWSPGHVPDRDDMKRLKECLEASMPAPLEYYRAQLRPVRSLRRRQRLLEQRIATPTLYLHGDSDGCVGAELADLHPRFFSGPARCEVIPGVGHFLQLEAPARVADLALAWLTEFTV
jgi:pimeloyl-ACP methyl ester carboxylesterase